MPLIAILFGAALIALGLDGFQNLFGIIQPTDLHSPTALIPAAFGVALVLCGLVAVNPNKRKHAMHLAAMIGLVGLLAGAGMGLPKLAALMRGEAQRPAAVKLQLWMGGICLVFVALCVNSFIQARRRRSLTR